MNPYNLNIIVQARTNSSRFPGKIVQPVDGDKSFLHIQLSRLLNLKSDIKVHVATTVNQEDDIIEEIATTLGINVYRGSENNVLSRFIECADKNGFAHIIRICSDNPFLDLNALEHLIDAYHGEDYLSYAVNGRPSILTHYGFFAEIVSLNALRKLLEKGDSACIEHVTNCIYTQPEEFSIRFVPVSISSTDIRCTLDTREDFETLKKIYFDWYLKTEANQHDYHSLIKFIEKYPSLLTQMENQIKQNSK